MSGGSSFKKRKLSELGIDGQDGVQAGHCADAGKKYKQDAVAGEQHPQHQDHRHALLLGSCCLDYIVAADKFPQEDRKMAVHDAEALPGGNACTSSVALSRLGVRTTLIAALKKDFIGNSLCESLGADGVNVHVLDRSTSSPFSYIINHKGTRTILHTPGKPATEEELLGAGIEALLDGATHLHIDATRYSSKSLPLAEKARARGIEVSVEFEEGKLGDARDKEWYREWVTGMLPLASLVFTSTDVPVLLTGESSAELGMARMLDCSRSQVVVTTLGAKGCVAVCTPSFAAAARTENPFLLPLHVQHAVMDAGADAHAVAGAGASASVSASAGAGGVQGEGGRAVHVWRCPAQAVEPDEIADTTGAGDAFIGGVLASWMSGHTVQKVLNVGSAAAAGSIRRTGGQAGLPRMADLHADLRW